MTAGEAMKEVFDPKEMQEQILKETKESLWWLKEEIIIWIKEFFGESKIGKFFGDKLSALAASILGVETEKEKTKQEKVDETNNKQEKTKTEKVEKFDPNKGLVHIECVTENVTAFIEKVQTIAADLWINPNRLMHIMYKESKVDPQAVNEDTNATWLIQFNSDKGVDYKTIWGKRYTPAEIKNMDNLAQLDLVADYYKPYKGKINSYVDLYLVTLYPAAIWKPDDFVLWSEVSDSRAKEVGRKNNMNNGNPITVAHVKNRIAKDIPDNYIAQFDGTPQTPSTA